ncbi:hypothetical protein QBC34DRAFT_38651 [Podospora aff. communis PSN243]|uniref:Protein SDS23 n=1 Tax=Podospora aff. communis PSN243 TaxID=3040156 RepID=A0AAV9GTN7_9PEZI|nr:hypothetical protein QBC34DRAFT_38651 [Podospora aff. communis PSN243]
MDPVDSSVRSTPGSNGSNSAISLPGVASPPERSNSQSSAQKPSHIAAHRQSFAENQRYPPPSPRAHRHPSFTQQAIQDLLINPPSNRHANPRYAGRDWRDIALSELVPDEARWANLDTSVEEATMTLFKNNTSNVVLIRETCESKTAISTFGPSDLNAYLLVVVGLATPDEEHVAAYDAIAEKAQSQTPISLREIQTLSRKEQLVVLQADSTLDGAMEAFGSGIHRILVTNQSGEVTGVLNQLRLLEFFWNEAANFPVIDRLYGSLLRDLQIGTQQIIAINADAPLADALSLMNDEGLTSVAVVDHGLNVVGNISTADVRHLTNATSLPLLKSSCMHFISVILSERGVERGRDSFPVFYVNPYSTLAHTVAKLVATNSHRMWVVESASPSPSAPATPLLQASQPTPTPATAAPVGATSPPAPTILIPQTTSSSGPQSPLPGQSIAAVPSAALPGSRISGRLTGVVSLTDILNLFAKSSGLHPSDPSEQRARRRRSSSSSVRPTIEGGRSSVDMRR